MSEDKLDETDMIRSIEDNITYLKKLNSEIEKIISTKPYKIANSIRKFNHEFIKGKGETRKNFMKESVLKSAQRKNNSSYKNPLLKIIALNNKRITELKKNVKNLEAIIEQKRIDNILINNDYEFIDLFILKCGWNMDLFQRPQHIAINTSEKGGLVIFRGAYDGVDKLMPQPIHKLKNNLFLLDMDNTELFDYLINKLETISKPKILHLYSTDNDITLSQIKEFEKKGFKILYEYVDEISSDISQREIPQETYEKHQNILKNRDYSIVATAEKLHAEVCEIRGENNIIFSCNGVEYDHWKSRETSVPHDLKDILNLKKPIIGYYGAIAPWLDFELIKKLLKEREDYQIVFIGQILNSALKEEDYGEFNNFHFLGAKNYYELNNYAKYFDVCTIPFVINEITESTSPIKLFEYMALNKPIVTTNLLECRKYESVLIAKNHDDFIEKIDLALQIKDDAKYIKTLDKEALQNTWKSKTEEILKNLEIFCGLQI